MFKYEMLVDVFAWQKCHKPKFKLQTFYGQLQHLFTINFSAATCLELNLNGIEATAGLNLHYYLHTGALHFVDATSIQCLVGWVKDGNKWAIIDWSGSLTRAVYMDEGED